MGLRSFIIKRVIYSFFLVIIVIVLNYIIFMAMPGDPTGLFQATYKITQEQIESQIKFWGLDQPHHIRIFHYISNLLSMRLGESFQYKIPVEVGIMRRLPYTLALLGGSHALAIVVGIFLGVYAAYKRGSLFDSASVTLSLITYTLPVFWMGMIFIYVFSLTLHMFPSAGGFPREWALNWPQPLNINVNANQPGISAIFNVNPSELLRYLGGYLTHITLPFMTLALFTYGGFLLLTRATMLDALTEDYITTAKAKGLPDRSILFKHALKNASLPLIVNIALTFGFIFSGAIITETVFTYPGMGGWIWEAIQYRDYPVLMGTFYIISIAVILAILISDLLYGFIDPRIKYG
jgi:peptide/nickel transport system permease protein